MTLDLAALALAALVTLPGQAAAQTITGYATATDGDTLRLNGQRIRIFGVDSPERAQICEGRDGSVYQCGRDAAAVMVELTRGQAVTCVTRDRDRYGRTVAVCYTAAGDLGEAMVRRGQAVDYARYSHGAYRAAEDAARSQHLGIWSGRFETPASWRRERRESQREKW